MSQPEPTKARYALTAPCMLTFINFAEPKAVTKGGKLKFSCNFELPAGHPDEAPLKALIVQVAREAHPGIDINAFHKPLQSGDKLADKAAAKGKSREFSRGKQVLTARSDYRPQLAYIDAGKYVDVPDDAAVIKARERDTFYSGVEALGEVELVWYDAVGENGTPGVTAYLSQVLSLKKGDKVMGQGRSVAETFKGYVGSISQESVAAGTEESW